MLPMRLAVQFAEATGSAQQIVSCSQGAQLTKWDKQ